MEEDKSVKYCKNCGEKKEKTTSIYCENCGNVVE